MTRIGIGLIFMLLLAGCGAGASGETPAPATEAPTRTPVPTYTPTLSPPAPVVEAPTTESVLEVATESVTPSAAPLLLPTATPVLAAPAPATTVAPTAADPILTVTDTAVNVRSGPGTDYPLVGLAVRAASYPITGRNDTGDWWQVCCFDSQPGWLFGPLVAVENTDRVAVTAATAAAPAVATEAPAVAAADVSGAPQQVEEPQVEEPPPVVLEVSPPVDAGGTAGNFDPNAQYQIVHYLVLGFDDNNGGIFNKGGQQLIFLAVLDQNGAPVDGAVVKDAVGDKLNVVTGSKGAGKAEIDTGSELHAALFHDSLLV